jgi:hypothetical protein
MPSKRSRRLGTWAIPVLACLALLLALVGAARSGSSTLGRVISGPSPFGGCSSGGLGGLFANAEVEPSLAVDPRDPRRLIVAYQQDRFSTGAARGLVASRSSDGGKTWARAELPFSLCAGGQTTGWQRASDPWVSIGPDGRAFLIGLGSGIAVSTSTDGGRGWSAPVTLAVNDSRYLVDKCTVTADPARAGVAYAVWQRYLRRPNGPPIESDTLLSVTRDGGRHWSSPRLVLAHTQDTGDVASVVLPGAGGTLFHLGYRQAGGVPGPGLKHLSTLLVQRSSDSGRTWTKPRRIARINTVAAKLRDPASGKLIRPGVASFALGSGGRLYAVWQDSRFGAGSIDQVAFARSADGGHTWSKPRRLDVGKRALGVVPTVAAAGTVVAVSYYAVSSGRNARDAQTWLAVSTDGGKTFSRRAVGPAFALGDAPLLAGDPSLLVPPGLFVGDYTGLAVRKGVAYAAFTTANHDSGNPTDVRFVRLPAG